MKLRSLNSGRRSCEQRESIIRRKRQAGLHERINAARPGQRLEAIRVPCEALKLLRDERSETLLRKLQHEEEQFSRPRLKMSERKVQGLLSPDPRGRGGHERAELLRRRR